MRRSMVRIGIAFALLIVVAGAVAAAGSQEAAAKQEPVVIRWHGSRGFPGDDVGIPDLVADLVSKKVGFPVEWELMGTAESNHTPHLMMLLAANDMPDCYLYMSLNEEFLSQAAAAFDIQEMIDNMPDLTKEFRGLMDLLNLEEDETWQKYQYENGMMKGVPRVWTGGWVPSGQMWRKDILDDLGYDIPTTLAEAEKVFEAYKAVYPDNYVLGSSSNAASWQALDIVFNAFGLSGGQNIEQNGVVKQDFATRQFREALQVLRRWYDKGFIDPTMHTNIEVYQIFSDGRYLVCDWIKDWDYDTGEPTRYLEPLREIPGAMAVAATHLKADENTKPVQMVWNPFLTQVTGLGKHLEQDREKLHKIMQVGNLFGTDEEVQFLAGSGLEGIHYELNEDRLPKWKPDIQAMTEAARMDKYGFGFYWMGTWSLFSRMSSRNERLYENFLYAPDAPYHKDKVEYFIAPVTGPVTDENGEVVQASAPTDWWQLVLSIMTGVEPIEYYDEWIASYYDSGGREWEQHATRLYGSK